MWDWLKETGRIAIESTSRLLRKLEMPELKVEDKQDEELRIESDRDPGGGYDPYNQPVGAKHRERGGELDRAGRVDPGKSARDRGRK